MAGRYLGRELEKGTWQLCYGSLRFVPIERWPAGARRYPVADAEATLAVCGAQETRAASLQATLVDEHGLPEDVRLFEDQARQTLHAWSFHLANAWGVRTDGAALDDLVAALRAEEEKDREYLVARGLVSPKMRGREPNKVIVGWKKETKLAQQLAVEVAQERGVELQRTPTGRPQLTKDAVAALGSEQLMTYQSYSTRGIYIANVEKLYSGTRVPIGVKYESLIETGRTSAEGNLRQNPPRKGGYRECVVPREGHVFFGADYDNGESCTFAQVCLAVVGRSALADLLNSGGDEHVRMAAALEGVTYEEMLARIKAGDPDAKALRQFAKIPNFGLKGGMGAPTLVDFARKNGVEIDEHRARELRSIWYGLDDAVPEYFAWVGDLIERTRGVVVQIGSGRIRARVGFTDAANGFFQALLADLAKDAFSRATRACYVPGVDDRLLGCRVPLFLHDEIIGEAPEDRAADAAEALSEIMREAAKDWCPDVPPGASPYLMRRWYKGAETVRDAAGRLRVWEPKAPSRVAPEGSAA
jgi:hypothetical protein